MNPLLQQRSAGVLCPLFSFPSQPRLGRWWGFLGNDGLALIDWMTHCGFGWWQILPLNPVDNTRSPYASPSSFALDPRLIDPTLLGLAVTDGPGSNDPDLLLQRLDSPEHSGLMESFRHFCNEQHAWLEDHALFQLMKSLHGQRPWTQWPSALRDRKSVALRDFSAAHLRALQALRFEQFIAWSQWQRVRLYARRRGIRVIGDLPIHVAWDSADVWAHRELFQLDAEGLPARITGVPPDDFSAQGQCWGMPALHWNIHAASRFAWWRKRLSCLLTLVDAVRLDHFNGFVRGWVIPAGHPEARYGRWEAGPGAALLSCWREDHPHLPLLAEDLGIDDPQVQQLRKHHGIPGMKVLQFAFDGDHRNPHLPHHHDALNVVYSGTHDNDTVCGWYEGLDTDRRRRVDEHLGHGTIPWSLLRMTLGSVAPLAVIPLADWLAEGSQARLNCPGALHGQWRWQVDPARLDAESVLRVHHLLNLYGRCQPRRHARAHSES